MKNSLHLAALAAVVAGLMASASAHAQQMPSIPSGAPAQRVVPVIGVVDTDALMRDSLAGKEVLLDREKYATGYQTQVKDMEAKLRTEDQELSQQRGVMAPDVFQEKANAFQQKLADYQNQVRDKQQRLEASFQQASNEIATTIFHITQDVAKERGINLVLPRSQLVIADESMDITKLVMERLNQRLTAVKFQDPDTLQPNAAGAAGGTSNTSQSTGSAKPTTKK
jgi:Skp family chaperone for outer membrane proteins